MADASSPTAPDLPLASSGGQVLYRPFRKAFHIPLDWASNSYFHELANMQYSKEEVRSSFTTIERLLRAMGYVDDNQQMLHDYIHFMIKDHLVKHGVPFLDEKDLKEGRAAELSRYLGGHTPDLFVKGKHIIDVYTGGQDGQEAKRKYVHHDLLQVHVVKPHSLASVLNGIKVDGRPLLPEADVEYIRKQYLIFHSEFRYWQSCLKLKMIMKNEVENVKINLLCLSAEEQLQWQRRRDEWLLITEQWFHAVNSGGDV
jgi:hypothetical protein